MSCSTAGKWGNKWHRQFKTVFLCSTLFSVSFFHMILKPGTVIAYLSFGSYEGVLAWLVAQFIVPVGETISGGSCLTTLFCLLSSLCILIRLSFYYWFIRVLYSGVKPYWIYVIKLFFSLFGFIFKWCLLKKNKCFLFLCHFYICFLMLLLLFEFVKKSLFTFCQFPVATIINYCK